MSKPGPAWPVQEGQWRLSLEFFPENGEPIGHEFHFVADHPNVPMAALRTMLTKCYAMIAEELEALRQKVTDAYDTSTDIRYAAARLWVDGIIDPADTRKVLIQSLEAVTLHAADEPFRTGVYQV